MHMRLRPDAILYQGNLRLKVTCQPSPRAALCSCRGIRREGGTVVTANGSGDEGSAITFGRWAGDDYGTSDDRPPLVLLHGLTFDRRMWGPAIKALNIVDPARRVLTLDLPGHGQSAPLQSYAMDDVVEALHLVVEEAGLRSPILVGHSIAAIIATIYAAQHPTSGVVNVDQPLQTGPFADMLRSMGDHLRSPAFPSIWEKFLGQMHIELLPADAQELLRSTSTPRQELVLGYWHDILNRPAADLNAAIDEVQAKLRSTRLPYLIVAGDEVDDGYREWLKQELPEASIVVLSGSGHFPQLAHPDMFARCLADTADWALR